MFQQIVDLKTNGPTAEEVATVQEQLQRSREEAEQNNDYAVGAQRGSVTHHRSAIRPIRLKAALMRNSQE